jgi:hypothetical protein
MSSYDCFLKDVESWPLWYSQVTFEIENSGLREEVHPDEPPHPYDNIPISKPSEMGTLEVYKEVEKARTTIAHALQITEWANAGFSGERGAEPKLIEKTPEEYKQAHKDAQRAHDHKLADWVRRSVLYSALAKWIDSRV